MANNPYVNKVIYGNDTVMDISDSTASESDVAAGKVFYKGTGERSVGTGNYYSPNDTAETDIQDVDYFPFYDTSASGKRKTLWSNVKSKLKTYFDALYQAKLTFDNYPKANSSNPVKSGGVYTALIGEENLTKDTIGYLVKNVWAIPSSVVDQTINGVTFTVYRDSNGQVTAIGVRGSATAQAEFNLSDSVNLAADETYIVSGGDELWSQMYLKFGFRYDEYYDYGDGVEITTQDIWPNIENVKIVVSADFEEYIERYVYPMIRKASIVDPSFEPYNGTDTVLDKIASTSNTKVTQTATTGNANYEVLFSQTADNTTRTEGARKNSNLKFNPSTGNLQATQLNGVTIGSSPKFTDTNTWRPVQNNLTSTSTSDCLSANQGRLLNNGKSNLISVSSVSLTVAEVTANGNKDFTGSAAKSGYTPLGVVGTKLEAGASIVITYCYLSGSTVNMRVHNCGSSAKTPGSTYAWVLYVKNSLT